MSATHNDHVEGLVRGAVGSVVGLAVMGLYFKAAEAIGGRSDGAAESEDTGPDPLEARDELDDISVVGRQGRDDEPATATVGRIGYEKAKGEEPDAETKQKLGRAVHWGYGVLVGGLYGALRQEADGPDLVAGLGYGTALWVVGDEIMVPLLGLSEGPTAHSIPEHAKGLGAHLAYGAATAGATQALKRVM